MTDDPSPDDAVATEPGAPSGFDALGLPEPLRRVLAELGHTTPTDVQRAAIPVLLAGRDARVRARTGSGKTLAFALPLLARLDPERRPQALVLAPTRELAAQVTTVVRTLGRRLPGLRVLAVTGGTPRVPQRRALGEGVHVVVGTPGRVRDLLEGGALDVAGVRTAVLDEADRMLALGFVDDVETILGALPRDRLTACVSATLPPDVVALAARWQRDPVPVEAGADAPPVRQLVVSVNDRLDGLRAVLAAHPSATTLVFCATKAGADEVARALGQGAAALHGDLDQRERDAVLARLRGGSVRVLVATDVAARGLDVDGLDLVVQLEPPGDAATWVHRTGRTGRAGRQGVAITLVTADDTTRLPALSAGVGPLERPDDDAPPPADDTLPHDATAQPAMATLRVGGGRKDKLRPGDLLGALVGEAGLAPGDVGRIEVHDHVAYVAVAEAVARRAAARLGRGRIKGRRFRVELVG